MGFLVQLASWIWTSVHLSHAKMARHVAMLLVTMSARALLGLGVKHVVWKWIRMTHVYSLHFVELVWV